MASLWVKLTDTFSRLKNGLVPQAPSGTGTTKYLREDGTWAVPSGGGGGGSSALTDLEDVNLDNLTDGQNLSYNGTTQKWENKTPPASGHTYSTTEQVVGTWLDGKPLYEKTVVVSNVNYNANFTYEHEIPNAEHIWIENVIFMPTDNDGNRKSATSSGGGLGSKNANTTLGARVDKTYIYGNGGESWGAQTFRYWYFIIHYTKTTD